MVKRKWLWGKKFSEKSSGETESSGSMSSHSDKFSEDQELLKGSPTTTESQEVDSKATEIEVNREEPNEREQNSAQKLLDVPEIDVSKDGLRSAIEETLQLLDTAKENELKDCFTVKNHSTVTLEDTQGVKVALQANNNDKEDNNSLKLLTEKLSAALVNVSLKDDLVKQHSKVAEEAVAGWEKAENEAATLKQQLEDAVQKKTAMEARVSHLDEALKECVRQLRLARDEQERKINQAVTVKTNELEIAKTRLEDQLIELQAIVETSRMNSPDPELKHRVDLLERENIVLRQEFQSLSEELEVRTIERDLSTKAAETASKQHLESIKKVARLEAECRKLKSLSRVYEHKSSTAAAAASCVDTVTDFHSDSVEQLSSSDCDSRKMNGSWASALIAELDQFKSDKVVDRNIHTSSKDINLMDDFLEMERLAALSDREPQDHFVGCDQTQEKAVNDDSDRGLSMEFESMARRIAELEDNICKVEAEKAELGMTLAQAQSCLEESQVQLIETQMKLDQLERELHGANEGEQYYKSLFIQFERETNLLSSQIKSLHAEIEREQELSEQKSARCEELESELKKKDKELEIQQDASTSGELKLKEMALAQAQDSLEKSETQLKQAETKLKELEKELQEANEEKKSLNSELGNVRAELHKMSSQIELLNEQVQKERTLVAELSTKTKELEHELQRKVQELETQQRAHSNNELKIKQEDLAIAAGKLADCQQTIASLGSQLKSLATLEDFLIDTASIPGFPPPAPLMARRSSDEPWKLHSNGTYLSEKEYEPLSNAREDLSPFTSHSRRDARESPASSSSSTQSAYFLNYPGYDSIGFSSCSYY